MSIEFDTFGYKNNAGENSIFVTRSANCEVEGKNRLIQTWNWWCNGQPISGSAVLIATFSSFSACVWLWRLLYSDIATCVRRCLSV